MSNLKKLTSEKAKQIGKKGGINSGEARRKRKNLKEVALTLLNLKVDPKYMTEESLKYYKNNLRFDEAMILAQLVKAINGDTQAAIYIRDVTGQKNPPEDTIHTYTNFFEFYEKNKDILLGEEW
jgi:hypothetical protein